jgi:RND family efflux transporter MFP subunit
MHNDIKDILTAKLRWRSLSVFIFISGLIGYFTLQALAPTTKPVPKQIQAPIVETETITVITGPIPISSQGLVKPKTLIDLKSEISGKIIQLSPGFADGGRFKKGEVLVEIDPRPFIAALEKVKADRAVMQADLKLAEGQLLREQGLVKAGASSERRRDESINKRDRTQAQIEAMDAQIKLKKIDLERATIRAPFSGYVLNKVVDLGSVVVPGAGIATIYNNDIFEVTVSLSDREAALIPGIWNDVLMPKPRAKVLLYYHNYEYEWAGSVERVEAGIDRITKTIDIIVRVYNPTQRGKATDPNQRDEIAAPPPLLIGTYPSVQIEGIQTTYSLIPRIALKDNNEIWLLTDESKIRKSRVSILQDQGDEIAIQGDFLITGAQVITSDLQVATNGLVVQTAKPDKL